MRNSHLSPVRPGMSMMASSREQNPTGSEICALRKKRGIGVWKAHELVSSASVKTRERSVAVPSGVACVKSSKSYTSGLGVFIYQRYVYIFFKVRKKSCSIVNPLSNLKYV